VICPVHFCGRTCDHGTRPMNTGRKRLGELLVEWGLIGQHRLDEVLALQQNDRRKLGVLLVERGYLGATKLTQLLSHQFSLPFVSLARVTYTPSSLPWCRGGLRIGSGWSPPARRTRHAGDLGGGGRALQADSHRTQGRDLCRGSRGV